jgi:hypothetical protein
MSSAPAWTGSEPSAEVRASFYDEAGNLLFEEVAEDGRRWVRRPDGNGGYVNNAEGVRRVLLNLPALRKHLETGQAAGPVYLTEGTSDARALKQHLAEHGLPGVVTTNPFGALSWLPEYTELLTGTPEVIATVDNDDAGRKRAALLERELGPVVEQLRILRTPLEEKGADLRDHLAAGKGLDELVTLAAEQDEATPPPPLEPFDALDLDAFLGSPPAEPEWEWRGWYARGDVVLAAGDPGVGKSLVALAGSVTAALGGGELLGEPIAARRVLFFDLESPEDVAYARLYAFGLRGRTDGFEYVHRPAYFNLLDAECLARLRSSIAAASAGLVVIDSLRRAAPGLDENDSRQVSILLTALRDIAAELGCTILVIHHPRKPVGDAKVEALYAARGSGDLIGSVDSYLFFRKLSGGLTRVEHGKARRGREHEHACYRILEGEAGEPILEHVVVEPGPEGRGALRGRRRLRARAPRRAPVGHRRSRRRQPRKGTPSALTRGERKPARARPGASAQRAVLVPR